MQCNSCNTNIDPKWKHAIDKNICPFCGQSILEEHLKQLISTLSTTMEQLQQYPSQLNDWMLANYSYIKTDDPNLITYLPEELLPSLQTNKPKKVSQEKEIRQIKMPDGSTQSIEVEKLVDDETTKSFMDRAKDNIKLVDKDHNKSFKNVQERAAYLKEMAQSIKKGETQTSYIKETDLNEMINENANQQQLDEAIDYQQMINESSSINSSINSQDMSQGLDDEKIPNFVLNLANKAKNNQSKKTNDLETLENLVSKSNSSVLSSGKGSFSRG